MFVQHIQPNSARDFADIKSKHENKTSHALNQLAWDGERRGVAASVSWGSAVAG